MKTKILGTLSLALLPTFAEAAPLNSDLMSCSGKPGVMVQGCSLGTQELAGVQPFDSDFYVTYTMSCNRSFPGPRASAIRARLENGKELVLNYNQSPQEFHAGLGRGPLNLLDSNPNELKNMRFNDCNLVITNVRVQMGEAERQRIEGEKQRVRQGYTDYYNASRSQTDFNRPLLLSSQIDYYFRIKQRVDAECLIHEWKNDDLYNEVVEDMTTKFTASFGEMNSGLDSKAKTYPQLDFFGIKCSTFSDEALRENATNPNTPANMRFLYQTCAVEKNYQSLHKWFTDRSSDLSNKISETRNAGLSDVADKMDALRVEIDNLTSKSCTPESSPVKSVPFVPGT